MHALTNVVLLALPNLKSGDKSQKAPDQGTMGNKGVIVDTSLKRSRRDNAPQANSKKAMNRQEAPRPGARSPAVTAPVPRRSSDASKAAPDASTRTPQVKEAVDKEMSRLIVALSASADPDCQRIIQQFNAALETLQQNSSSSADIAGTTDVEHLKTQLGEVPSKALKSLGEAANTFLNNSPTQAVAVLSVGIQMEIARRDAVLRSADGPMDQFLQHLLKGNFSDMRAPDAAFSAILRPLTALGLNYNDRLLMRLGELSEQDLNDVAPAARRAVERPHAYMDGATAQYVSLAASIVLLQRMSPELQTMDHHLGNVLKALASGEDSTVLPSVDVFNKAAQASGRSGNEAFTEDDVRKAVSSPDFGKCLHRQLAAMPQAQFEKVTAAFASDTSDLSNPVLNRIWLATQTESRQRSAT
ncbi:hypothetical protein [Hydrogenophaga sp. BPS33]|uniref:hypothetical protein n=1 Tax=Hydrogenophaga sp. BPS33 TaxID=2651974 RepID=UPI00131FD7FF|nr:hypothetical protein [Hydrogenophaga sp. BPS33]QHE86491.1 hypothetical protein F9K07_17080 [Hydrogenophaga sp. BPS33]